MEWFFLCFGIFLFVVGILVIKTTCNCKREVKGIYVKSNVYRGTKAQSSYAPVFRYTFEGQEYEQQSLQSFSEKYIRKHFDYGREYSIFIDEKKPRRIVARQRVQAINFWIVVFGIVFMGIAIIGLGVK